MAWCGVGIWLFLLHHEGIASWHLHGVWGQPVARTGMMLWYWWKSFIYCLFIVLFPDSPYLTVDTVHDLIGDGRCSRITTYTHTRPHPLSFHQIIRASMVHGPWSRTHKAFASWFTTHISWRQVSEEASHNTTFPLSRAVTLSSIVGFSFIKLPCAVI